MEDSIPTKMIKSMNSTDNIKKGNVRFQSTKVFSVLKRDNIIF